MKIGGKMVEEPSCIMEIRTKRVPDTKENYEMCYCGSCPTYNQCMSQSAEKLYCSRNKTGCNLERLGCVCGECNVAIKYALSSNYYCVIGTAKF